MRLPVWPRAWRHVLRAVDPSMQAAAACVCVSPSSWCVCVCVQDDVRRFTLVTDELFLMDVSNMVDDHRYFPFEEVLEQVGGWIGRRVACHSLTHCQAGRQAYGGRSRPRLSFVGFSVEKRVARNARYLSGTLSQASNQYAVLAGGPGLLAGPLAAPQLDHCGAQTAHGELSGFNTGESCLA